jgi:hypothetical protein
VSCRRRTWGLWSLDLGALTSANEHQQNDDETRFHVWFYRLRSGQTGIQYSLITTLCRHAVTNVEHPKKKTLAELARVLGRGKRETLPVESYRQLDDPRLVELLAYVLKTSGHVETRITRADVYRMIQRIEEVCSESEPHGFSDVEPLEE